MESIFKKHCILLPSATWQQRGQGYYFLFAIPNVVIAFVVADAKELRNIMLDVLAFATAKQFNVDVRQIKQ